MQRALSANRCSTAGSGPVELHLDRVLLEHQVVALQLDVGIGIAIRKRLLDVVDIAFQRLRRLEIDNQLAVRKRRRGDAAHQIVARRRAADRSGHRADLRTALQIAADLLQIGLHAGRIRPLGQFVLHIELVVDHIGEEALTHVTVAPDAQPHQHERHGDRRPAMPQAEAERRTQPAVDSTVVERRAAGRSSRLTEPCVGHERHMHQRQHPAQQQRHGQHDEQIAHVDTRRIGREEDRQERKDGDQRRTQQRHRRLPADGRHRLAARFPEFQVDQDAVHDHDGIVDQHSHGQDERRQRHALHRSVGHPQNQERSHDGHHQTDAG